MAGCVLEIMVQGDAFGVDYPVRHRAEFDDDPGAVVIADFLQNILGIYYSNIRCTGDMPEDESGAWVKVPPAGWGQ